MDSVYVWVTNTFDPVVAAVLVPLAVWILLSGVDDLVVDFIGLYAGSRSRRAARRVAPLIAAHPEKRIAIMVPCWGEHRVIASMVQHNLQAIRYTKADFFIGTYPNDEATTDVVQHLAATYQNVHAAPCPHDGPTSKADCLNWIYQRIIQFENEQRTRFDILVTHDAEDVIHPDALQWINFYSDTHHMIQVPVLPLRTALSELVHGVYCDEFSEYQTRDMPARQFMGGFVPSNGVGTGFRRDALERLAAAEQNRVFEPVCLTEDYENGYRLHRLGCTQSFLPIHTAGVATREFFPRHIGAAVRQRTRWTTGIALQTWDRHGWRGSAVTRYWLWRDRKGLVGNPISVVTNLLFIYGLLTWIAAALLDRQWQLGGILDRQGSVLTCSALLGIHRFVMRAQSVSAVYGWACLLVLPFRIVVGNLINSIACFRALYQFFSAKLSRRPLVWVKTEHQYPSQCNLAGTQLSLSDVLIGSGYIDDATFKLALARKPEASRLGDYLVAQGLLSEDALYEALGLQHGLPQRYLNASEVDSQVARALPHRVARECQVLPFKVEFGNLLVAVAEVPSDDLRDALRPWTTLPIRFQLVTPTNWRALQDVLLCP